MVRFWKMSDKARREARVIEIIRSQIRGGTAGAIGWAMIGGRFDSSGNAVTTELGRVSPHQFLAAAKAGTRASEVAGRVSGELRKSKRVDFRIPGASSQNVGYWPAAGALPRRYRSADSAGSSVRAGVADQSAATVDVPRAGENDRARAHCAEVAATNVAAILGDSGLE